MKIRIKKIEFGEVVISLNLRKTLSYIFWMVVAIIIFALSQADKITVERLLP